MKKVYTPDINTYWKCVERIKVTNLQLQHISVLVIEKKVYAHILCIPMVPLKQTVQLCITVYFQTQYRTVCIPFHW